MGDAPYCRRHENRAGGGCLHLSSQLCLVLCPSRSVSCRISQRLSLSLSSRLRLEPWPPLFIMPQPFVAPLSFGWLSHCPSASTPISSQLCLVPWPPPLVDPLLMTAFGVVCRRSRCHIHPVRHHLPQSGRPPNIAVSGVVAAHVRHQRGASFAVAVAAGTIARVRCQRGVSPAVARLACPSPGRGPKEGASPSQ
jgi:hypothetical protein